MPIVTPRRRYIQHGANSRIRYGNFREWLDRESARLVTVGRAVRDRIQRLGPESTLNVEQAADSNPQVIGVKSNGAPIGGVGYSVTSGVFVDGLSATEWQSLGFTAGDAVQITYLGDDFPNPEVYFATVTDVTAGDMTVAPAPPDNAWPATTQINVSTVNADARE